MQNKGIATHNIRIAQAEGDILREAARTGLLLKRSERLSGLPEARVYVPAAKIQKLQSARSLDQLKLGSLSLRAALHRLPDLELSALLAQSPGVQVRADRDDLINQLLRPMTWISRRSWIDQVIRGAGYMEGPTQAPQGVEWVPDATRIAWRGGLWFAVLTFSVSPPARDCTSQAGAMGVDVGLAPLAVAASSQRVVRTRRLHLLHGAALKAWERQLLLLPALQQEQARRDREHVEAAAASQVLEELTTDLIRHASRVVAEALDPRTFGGEFIARARERAVLDWHQAVLPQRLHAAKIPFQRVNAAFTSMRCCRCGRLGRREAAVLHCSQCGPQDAHVNAALNIVRRGAGIRAQGRRR